MRYRSDKADGPTAGTETVDPLEFLARVTAHVPNQVPPRPPRRVAPPRPALVPEAGIPRL